METALATEISPSDPPAYGDRAAGDREIDTEAREGRRDQLQNALTAYLRRGRARVIVTDNVYTMLSVKRGSGGVYTFRLHHMFLEAPGPVVRAVATYAEGQTREASALLRRFIDHNDASVRAAGAARSISLDAQGRYHDLDAIFDDLNAEYFDELVQARITWGSRAKRKRGRDSIKLGSYTLEDELIRIHPVLDAEDVPRFFVAWVVFHEMLHEVHDMPVVDGRRVYHTREFRNAESRYEHYAESVLWERTHIHRLLDR